MSETRFSTRQILVYLAVAALLCLSSPVPPTFLAGSGLAAIGVALRIWACGHLRKNKDWITSGPYAHVQHPLYLGTFLVALGGIVAAGSPGMPGLLVWVAGTPALLTAFFGYYLPRKMRVEGRRMAERFGHRCPPGYAESVPAFIPSLQAWPRAARSRWSWRVYLGNRELGTDLLVAALFALVFLARAIRPGH
jgi:protein-S-isoprenylcysteine O-methyltransferase Ste14